MRDELLIYTLFTTSAGQRSFRKLSQEIQDHVFESLQILKTQPYTGEQLQGELRFLRSLHTRYKNTDYRVAYEVNEREKAILIWYIASRENFYEQLRRLPLKSATRQ